MLQFLCVLIMISRKKIKKASRKLFLRTESIVDFFLVKAINRFPLFLKASLKYNLEPIGFLDYPKKKIRILINSSIELKRLRACVEEPDTVKWIAENVRPGDIFYDIGANVGAYSFIFSAEALEKCSIYAFEPNPFTFSSLSRNILLNGMEGTVTPFNLALSDKTGLANFFYSSLKPGVASSALEHTGNQGHLQSQGFQRVMVFTLDDLAEKFSLKYPNMLKIDVDGAEYNVINGARKILANSGLRHVLVEIDERIDTCAKTISIINSYGFNFISKRPARKSRKKVPVVFNYIFSR